MGDFVVDGRGKCQPHCAGLPLPLELHFASEAGWSGAYFGLYSESTGSQVLGGTVSAAVADSVGSKGVLAQSACVAPGCYMLLFERRGSDPSSALLKICGVQVGYRDTVRVCVSTGGGCSATLLRPTASPPCGGQQSQVDVFMFAPGLGGWGADRVAITPPGGDTLLSATPAVPALVTPAAVCLDDGCYDFTAGSLANSPPTSDNFWTACGVRGSVPWATDICVDSRYGLCYGLTGCPVLKTYSRVADNVWYLVYDDAGAILAVDNAHSVHELCELDDGCYNVFLGVLCHGCAPAVTVL